MESQLDHTSRVWNTLVTPSAEMDQYYRRDYAYDGRIMSAEAYAALSHLVDDNAQQLDQDVRPRVRAGAAISSKDISPGVQFCPESHSSRWFWTPRHRIFTLLPGFVQSSICGCDSWCFRVTNWN